MIPMSPKWMPPPPPPGLNIGPGPIMRVEYPEMPALKTPKWWWIGALALVIGWSVYAVMMTVDAWPDLTGQRYHAYTAWALGFYYFGIVGSFGGLVLILCWSHASIVLQPYIRKMMLLPPPRVHFEPPPQNLVAPESKPR